MTEPAVEISRGLGPVYFTDAEGTRWRVLDAIWVKREEGRGGWRWKNPPSSKATHRLFRSEAGVKRVHKFNRAEDRQLVARLFELQLWGAEYLATGKFDAKDQQPR